MCFFHYSIVHTDDINFVKDISPMKTCLDYPHGLLLEDHTQPGVSLVIKKGHLNKN